jgi:GDP-L-fucose synthase
MDLAEKRILVTGGSGFLGSHVMAQLKSRGCRHTVSVRSREHDLVDASATARLFEGLRPELVIHLAARVGGIGANQKNPASYFHDNLLMGVNVIEQARRSGVEKVVLAGTICAYPKHTPLPFREEELWNGYPEETNAPYGIAKKALFVMADAYRRQYGLNTVCLLPVNLYGPRDNFDLESSHVIPAMIRKLLEAKARGDDEVVLWGDGTPTREFLYVDDCARAIVLAAERYDESDPVNIGAGFEISMRALAEKIAKLCEFTGSLRWDTSRPNGQPRRSLDTTRARERFGFSAEVRFDEGLARTIAWYRAQTEGGS